MHNNVESRVMAERKSETIDKTGVKKTGANCG